MIGAVIATSKRQGRPVLPHSERRVFGPSLRFTSSEYTVAKRRARRHGRTIAGGIRHACLSCDLGPAGVQTAVPALREAGKHLNLLTYRVHAGITVNPGQLVSALEVIQVLAEPLVFGTPASLSPPVAAPHNGPRRLRGLLRVTISERAEIRHRATIVGLSQEEFVRRAALGEPLSRRASWKAGAELSYIENNLYQLLTAAPLAGVAARGEIQPVIDVVDRALTILFAGGRRRRAV